MNIHQSEVLEFLNLLGANVTVVDDETASEYDKDTLLGLVDNSRLALHRPQIESEMKDKYITDAKGVAGGTLRSQLARNFGISLSDLKDKDLNDADAIQKAIEHFRNLHEGEKEDVNKKIEEIIAKNKEANDAYKVEMENKLSEAVKRYHDRDIKDFVQSKLKEVAIKQDADISKVASLVINSLSEDLDFKYDEENRSAVPFYKNSELKALNVAKNSEFDWKERIESVLKPFSLIENDMKGRSAADAMKGHEQKEYQSNKSTPTYNGGSAEQKTGAFMEKIKGAIAQTAPTP